jgi:hypothetical protein
MGQFVRSPRVSLTGSGQRILLQATLNPVTCLSRRLGLTMASGWHICRLDRYGHRLFKAQAME